MSESLGRLRLRDLGYRVQRHTLIDGVSLSSPADCCTALLGANGAGKSTFLRLCHGLLTPTSGEVHWGTRTPRAAARWITMVFQRPCLLGRSAYANVDYALRLHGIRGAERGRRVTTALQLINLTHRAHHQAQSLSGGEQRRLALARAWVLQPEVILMDEPTAGLDVVSSQAVEEIITNLSRQGIKIIIASHNLAQVRRLCDEVIFLDQGRVVQQCGTREFFENPTEKSVCEFINSQAFS